MSHWSPLQTNEGVPLRMEMAEKQGIKEKQAHIPSEKTKKKTIDDPKTR